MEKTVLWQTLLALPLAERKMVGKMLRSPFFNQRAALEKAFEVLLDGVVHKMPPTREMLFAEVFPGQLFDGAQMRTVMFQLTEVLRQYLILKQLRQKTVYEKILLAEAFRQLELDDWGRDALLDAENTLERADYRDAGWYDLRFQLFANLGNQPVGMARTQALDFQAMSDSLEQAFMLRKLKLACELLSHQAVYKTAYDLGLLDTLLQHIGRHERWLAQQDIALYYYCCLALLRSNEPEHFQQLKPLLLRAESAFPPSECRDIMLLTLNFCIRKLNEGDTRFAHEGLELYQHALAQGYLLENGFMSRFTFRNIVGMGIKIKAFDWVEYFILNYRDKLPPEHHESMVSFNLARLAYIRQHYGEAIALLQKADYEDLLLNLAARVLLMKIYYETKASRSLEAALDAAKIFLRRKKIIGYHRDNYHNIFRYFEKLLALNPFNPADRKALQTALEQEEPLTEREWFLEMLRGG